jgi:hypothetical protein
LLSPANTHLVQIGFRGELRQIGQTVRTNIVVGTNIPGYRRITVPISAHVVQPVLCCPNVVSFGNVNAASRLENTVSILPLDNEPVRIVSVDTGDDEMRCSAGESPFHNAVELRFSCAGAAALRLSGRNCQVKLAVGKAAAPLTLKLPFHALPCRPR